MRTPSIDIKFQAKHTRRDFSNHAQPQWQDHSPRYDPALTSVKLAESIRTVFAEISQEPLFEHPGE
jgi:hypothetical protein